MLFRSLNKIYFLFLVLNCSGVFSQDSITHKFRHSVGAEILGTVGREKADGHFRSGTNYKPGYSLFYRLYTKKRLGFESRLLYRSGFGTTTDGGNGGYSTLSGDFMILRLDAGLLFSSKQNDSPENFEFGLKFGHTVFQTGEIKRSGFGNGIYTESDINTSSALNQYYVGTHLGVNFRIKLAACRYIQTGFRLYCESRDFEETSLNFTGGLFAAYYFH
jgi:hypothetical protein